MLRKGIAKLVPYLFLLLLPLLLFSQSRPGTGTNTRSPHGSLAIPCANCHTSASWKPIRAIPEFDHNRTKFPLRGLHVNVACTQCHTKAVFTNIGTKCADCHADIHRGQLGATCDSCHTVKGWQVNLKQIQGHTNRFPLAGAHAVAACEDCHKSGAVGTFTGLSTVCYSCHAKDYQGVTVPNHVSAGFSKDCQTCHSMNSWLGAAFDHAAYGFPLTGGHANLQCTQCHVNNNFNLTSTACANCHLPDFQKTTNPNHVQGGFPQTCEQCHTIAAWKPATFDHNLVGFPLTGGHANLQCAQCHTNNNYNLASTACVGCHLKDYQNTSNPNHTQQNIPQTCEMCHSTTAWQPAQFDHSKSGFPLTGTHVTTPCAQCHVNNNYNLTNTACVSCHQTDYNNARTPIDHIGLNFPITCQNCHDTIVWTDGKFDHTSTGWALTGTHAATPCSQCHVNNNYNLTNTSCVSCHQTDYNNAKTPVDHIALGFPTTCQNCHDTIVWTDGKFDHATTGWALTGTHLTTPCAQCHVNNNYNLTTYACASCHQTDYNNAKTPVDHIAAGFPVTCETCHDTVVWTDGKFDHTTTGWALTGTHLPTPCSQCHVNGNYKLTNTACVSCHQTDYNNALSPVNHIALGFPTTCQNCHDTVVWTNGTFNHATTGWPLTGMHATIACNLCHVNNNYTLNNTNCVTCHLTDYNGTTNPNHKAAGFPTTCQTCHDTTNWLNATFNHTYFPMTHGNANGVCATCHTNPSDYSVFTCTNCHTKAQTDSNHQGVRGYVYNSANCYSCHPTGLAG